MKKWGRELSEQERVRHEAGQCVECGRRIRGNVRLYCRRPCRLAVQRRQRDRAVTAAATPLRKARAAFRLRAEARRLELQANALRHEARGLRRLADRMDPPREHA